jgi:hypothetical protein
MGLMMIKRYYQIILKSVSDGVGDVFLDIPRFKTPMKIGTAYRDTATFRSIQRTPNNLVHFFGYPALGVNEEVIKELKFIKIIEIPFNDTILRTTKLHLLKHAIPSPFCSSEVDKQLIIAVDKFYVPEVDPEPKEKQAELFEVNYV